MLGQLLVPVRQKTACMVATCLEDVIDSSVCKAARCTHSLGPASLVKASQIAPRQAGLAAQKLHAGQQLDALTVLLEQVQLYSGMQSVSD